MNAWKNKVVSIVMVNSPGGSIKKVLKKSIKRIEKMEALKEMKKLKEIIKKCEKKIKNW